MSSRATFRATHHRLRDMAAEIRARSTGRLDACLGPNLRLCSAFSRAAHYDFRCGSAPLCVVAPQRQT
jgi:hypothetical protein